MLNSFDRDLLLRLTKKAKVNGYKSAIKCCLLPSIHSFACNENRADWWILLPIDKKKKVLYLEPTFGAAMIALSRIAKSVVAAGHILDSLKFIAIRARQESINNIKYTQIHSMHTMLPFRSESFDLVIFNGAFEDYKYTDKPKQKNQQFKIFLTELNRLLKMHGHLYVVLRNRFALDHTILTKTHTAAGKRILKRNNLSLTYWAYRKLFKICNFKKTLFFIPLNSYLHPNFIFSFDDIHSIQYIMKLKFQFYLNRYLKLIPMSTFSFMMNFVRYFAPDYIVIAEKQDGQ